MTEMVTPRLNLEFDFAVEDEIGGAGEGDLGEGLANRSEARQRIGIVLQVRIEERVKGVAHDRLLQRGVDQRTSLGAHRRNHVRLLLEEETVGVAVLRWDVGAVAEPGVGRVRISTIYLGASRRA